MQPAKDTVCPIKVETLSKLNKSFLGPLFALFLMDWTWDNYPAWDNCHQNFLLVGKEMVKNGIKIINFLPEMI